jgi:hypothetical protein
MMWYLDNHKKSGRSDITLNELLTIYNNYIIKEDINYG